MVILGLGSNVGDRLAHLREAVRLLAAHIGDIRCSRILESAPMLPEGAPSDWAMPFFNMAVAGNTSLSPAELLAEVKSIEQEIGRVKRGFWGPREIDIDILAMDAVVMDTPELSIPHRGIMERDFVLLPLLDVAPDWCCPTTGQRAADIAAKQRFALNDALRDSGLRIA